jgi:hypothetical protein
MGEKRITSSRHPSWITPALFVAALVPDRIFRPGLSLSLSLGSRLTLNLIPGLGLNLILGLILGLGLALGPGSKLVPAHVSGLSLRHGKKTTLSHVLSLCSLAVTLGWES